MYGDLDLSLICLISPSFSSPQNSSIFFSSSSLIFLISAMSFGDFCNLKLKINLEW